MPKVAPSHLDARRDEILRAAHRCFARHGFHRTTMRDIADEVELSAGALYRYFGGKKELLETLAGMGRRGTEVMEQVTRSDASRALAAAAAELLAPLADPAMMDSLRLDLRLWAEALDEKALRDLTIRAFDEIRAPIAELARRGETPNTVGSPETVAAVFLSLILGAEVQKVFDPHFDSEAYCETVRRLLT